MQTVNKHAATISMLMLILLFQFFLLLCYLLLLYFFHLGWQTANVVHCYHQMVWSGSFLHQWTSGSVTAREDTFAKRTKGKVGSLPNPSFLGFTLNPC